MRSQVRGLFYVAVMLSPLLGCECQCGSELRIISDGGVSDGGADGGHRTGGGAGGGKGGGQGGGGGGIVITLDGGDQSSGLSDGGFTVDGGSGGVGDGVKLDPQGNIIIGGGSTALAFAWIANNVQGWVSKFDTRTGKEVGRYFSVVPKDCAGSAGPPCAGGQNNNLSAQIVQNPSRTAIDRNGDLWVANRAVYRSDVTMVGSVTKIANSVVDCIDRNGNGKIDTSTDLNGDGTISTNPADHEMIIPTDYSDIKQYDECVLFTQPVGGPVADVGARALAVAAGLEPSGPGDIWVAIFHEKKVYKLNGHNGQIMPVRTGVGSIDLPFGGYGAIIDRLQRLWVVKPGTAVLALIDTTTGTLVNGNIDGTGQGCSAYGIGIDGKNRVWLPSWSTNAQACRYDQATASWTKFTFPPAGLGHGRGIAVDVNGQVYMSIDGLGSTPKAQLVRFDAETGAVIPFGGSQFIDATDSQTSTSIGVALDTDGNPWVNNYSGNAMKIDKTTGAVTRTAQQPAGLYTYSDFTGYQLRNYTAPKGVWQHDYMGCADVNTWKTLSWTATVPPNTAVQVFVIAADTQAGLSDTGAVKYGGYTTSPVDLDAAGVPHKRYLRVMVVLTSSDGSSTPVLKSLDLNWNCDGTIN